MLNMPFYIMCGICVLLLIDRYLKDRQLKNVQDFLMYHKDSTAYTETGQPVVTQESCKNEAEQLKSDYDAIIRNGIIPDHMLDKFQYQEPIIQ